MADDNKQTALVPFEGFRSELVARQDEIAALLPSTITREAFVNTAIVAVKNNPALLQCDRRSLHKAVTAAAIDGLKADGKEGAMIPQREDGTLTARWAPMAYGIRKRAKELDGIIIDAQVVYDADRFEWSQGDDARIVHIPAPLGTDRGKPVGVYAIFRRGSEVLHREVMTAEQIEAVRAISKQPNGLMWGKFTDEAWRKTVVRRGAKTVPCSDALRTVMERDDDLYDVTEHARDIAPAAPRLAPVKGPAILIAWQPGDALEHVPVKKFKDRALAFVRSTDASALADWTGRNKIALREFWGADRDAALQLKAEIEKAAARREPTGTPREPTAPAPAQPTGEPASAQAGGAQEAMEAEVEDVLDDRDVVVRDIIAALGREHDPKKRKAIFDDSAKARESMTDEQVARLKAALDQMELAAGKPRGKAA